MAANGITLDTPPSRRPYSEFVIYRYTLLSDPPSAARPTTVAASQGERDESGKLFFPNSPDFRPALTPRECLLRGVFGGCYFNPKGGKEGIFGRSVAIDHTEFPAGWFESPLSEDMYQARRYLATRNRYGVKSGQDQAFWESKGWIHERDPRGWFQWYCRFYQGSPLAGPPTQPTQAPYLTLYLALFITDTSVFLSSTAGRRCDDDERQIKRWAACAGAKGRWRGQLCGKVKKEGKAWDDEMVSPVIRQTLLHWAYELNAVDWEAWRATH